MPATSPARLGWGRRRTNSGVVIHPVSPVRFLQATTDAHQKTWRAGVRKGMNVMNKLVAVEFLSVDDAMQGLRSPDEDRDDPNAFKSVLTFESDGEATRIERRREDLMKSHEQPEQVSLAHRDRRTEVCRGHGRITQAIARAIRRVVRSQTVRPGGRGASLPGRFLSSLRARKSRATRADYRDLIDQIPEYRAARAIALQYEILRSVNR